MNPKKFLIDNGFSPDEESDYPMSYTKVVDEKSSERILIRHYCGRTGWDHVLSIKGKRNKTLNKHCYISEIFSVIF